VVQAYLDVAISLVDTARRAEISSEITRFAQLLGRGRTGMSKFDLTVNQILGWTVLAAIVTTIGNLIATVLKEVLFTRSFEKWKAGQQLHQVYLKLRDPLLLATLELTNRTAEITSQSEVNFLEKSLLQSNPPSMTKNSADDPYYQRYKFVSTIFRLCSWLGWVELYRQEVAFLDSGHHRTNVEFEQHVEAIRSCLADGHLIDADDWEEWTDSLIFREEQRAIGESMIDPIKHSVIGYGSFYEKFIATNNPSSPWIGVATNWLTDLKSVSDLELRDFRRARCLLLINHGVSLIRCLNKDRVEPRLTELQNQAQAELRKMPVLAAALPSKA
jgi:hypothetical protein